MNSPSKIGRLPRPLQKELNRRLLRGESSTPILEWLNPLPEVQAILQADFGGAPINKQNLSDWRATGLVKWKTRREVLTEILDFDGDAAELDAATQGRLAERLATSLAGRYARLLHHWDGEVTDEFNQKLRALNALTQNVSHLRRWDHSAARVKLEQTRLVASQEPDNEALFMKFEEWALNIGVQEYLTAFYASERDRERARRQLLGLPPLPEDPAKPAPGVGTACPHNRPAHAATENQPSSAPLSSMPENGGAGRGEAALHKSIPTPSHVPNLCPPAQSPEPGAQSLGSPSSTPSPAADSASKPLSSLANSSSTPPHPVNPCQPPATAERPRPGRGNKISDESPEVVCPEPAAPSPKPPSPSALPAHGRTSQGGKSSINNASSPSQASLAGEPPAVASPEPKPLTPDPIPIPSPCIGVCQRNGGGFCLGCFRNTAEIVRWPTMAEVEKAFVVATCAKRQAASTPPVLTPPRS